MILAEKIIELRKKEGWSQEQLAEMVGVSRQSISKWESAQSVPDMGRILKLSEVFAVSTDFLLKDDMDFVTSPMGAQVDPFMNNNQMTYEPAFETATGMTAQSSVDADDKKFTYSKQKPLTPVSMDEANDYLNTMARVSIKIAFAVFLCILSPIAVIVLSGAVEQKVIPMKETPAMMIGVIALLVMVAVAVGIFITIGTKTDRFEYLKKEPIDTEYGVAGMVSACKEQEAPSHGRQMVIGIMLCVLSVIPLLATIALFEDNAFYVCAGVGALLFIVAVGVFFIISASVVWDSYDVLLEQGDYTRAKKEVSVDIAPIYWGIAVAIYLAASFITGRWDVTWIMWPVAGILYGVVSMIYEKHIA